MPRDVDNPEGDQNQPENDSQGESDKDRNWRRMEERLAALEEENKELRPLQTERNIREAGYDPTSDKGKAIKYALQAKGEDAPGSPEDIAEFVVEEFNWKPSKALTDEEREVQDSQSRVDRLRQQSESDEEPDEDAKIIEAEQSAETEEDWLSVGMAKLGRTTQKMMDS